MRVTTFIYASKTLKSKAIFSFLFFGGGSCQEKKRKTDPLSPLTSGIDKNWKNNAGKLLPDSKTASLEPKVAIFSG